MSDFTATLPKDGSFTVNDASVTFTSKTEVELNDAHTEDQAAEICALAGFEGDFSHTEGEGKDAVDVTYGVHGERIVEPHKKK